MATSTYLNAIKPLLPAEYAKQIDKLDTAATTLLEAVLRFISGGECPKGEAAATCEQWAKQQGLVVGALERLKSSASSASSLNHKRAREEDHVEEPDAKKPKSATDNVQDDDDPLYTLHSISVTAPLRKKVNISVHRSSIRFINPTTKTTELSIPLSHLNRAFLLPTRGKTKPHWTVLIMSNDTPLPNGKAAASTSATAKEEQPQIIFGVDATPPPFSTTNHVHTPSNEPISHPKGTPILPFLRAFLSHLPFRTLEPSTAVFRSALSSGDGSAGVEGYRGAKSGTLWFLAEGILWDGKPCEFWSLRDLVGGRRNAVKGHADVDLGGAEGVRTVSATGRTCSVILSRKVLFGKTEDAMDVGEDQEEESVDTDVGMVDGKEQEVIARWVKKYRDSFGIVPAAEGNVTAAQPAAEEDDSDEDDSDFEQSSSDGGSPTSSSDEDSEHEGHGGDDKSDAASEDLGSGSDRSEDVEDDEDGNEEEELDPAHHPLLRPGAMPKMSRAAIDAVVGMVQEDLMTGATSLERRATNDPGESGDDEEDELED